jgi:hypothetical protein
MERREREGASLLVLEGILHRARGALLAGVEEPVQLFLTQLEGIGLVPRCPHTPPRSGIVADGIEIPVGLGARPDFPWLAVPVGESSKSPDTGPD